MPNIDNSDKKAILESLNQPILTNGPNLQKFEKVFAKFTGAKYAIGVTNATAALILSLNALGLKKNDSIFKIIKKFWIYRKIIVKLHPDVIQSWMYHSNLITLFSPRQFRQKII